MAKISWDINGFSIDGKPTYLVSGEFHYFRVPANDWARRMRLFKEAGGNCLATYVPWIVHEPEEGHIVFGDEPQRDLAKFLETAQAEGLIVVLRPGPYQYSELVHGGLPRWLLKDHPELLAKSIDGSIPNESNVSYLHPAFLEKARKYFKAFADVARPYMASNGGPVCMLQVDNEMRGPFDYNEAVLERSKAGGRWEKWLIARYEDISALNVAYETAYASFREVEPPKKEPGETPAELRRTKDFAEFYYGMMAEYAATLKKWLREDGLQEPICHNSACPANNSVFVMTVKAMGEDFLLGSDHYYALDPSWDQNNPTPQYALKCLKSFETLRAMGMPPMIFELPGGSLSDTPPILPEDLLTCYRLNCALGMKGSNYYIFTGGVNYPGTGTTGEIYDYNAPISAFGEISPNYAAVAEYGKFVQEHGWMQQAERATSVQLGFTWDQSQMREFDFPGEESRGKAWHMLEKGLLFGFMSGSCAPAMVELTGELDKDKPLFVVCSTAMNKAAQEAIVRFVEEGGNAVLLPVLPETDENGFPCTILKDFTGIRDIRRLRHPDRQQRFADCDGVFMLAGLRTATFPEDAEEIAWDDLERCPIGVEIKRGKGRLIWLGLLFQNEEGQYNLFRQAAMLEKIAQRMGAKETVRCSNRNIFTALWQSKEHEMLFVMNLYTGRQKTHIQIGEKDLGEITLAPMEVRSIELR